MMYNADRRHYGEVCEMLLEVKSFPRAHRRLLNFGATPYVTTIEDEQNSLHSTSVLLATYYASVYKVLLSY